MGNYLLPRNIYGHRTQPGQSGRYRRVNTTYMVASESPIAVVLAITMATRNVADQDKLFTNDCLTTTRIIMRSLCVKSEDELHTHTHTHTYIAYTYICMYIYIYLYSAPANYEQNRDMRSFWNLVRVPTVIKVTKYRKRIVIRFYIPCFVFQIV